MDEASQQTGSRASAQESAPAFTATGASSSAAPIGLPIGSPRHDGATPTLSIRFTVDPRKTVTWKIASDSTLRVCRERIWLTRARSPYDYWLGPGEAIGLARGERIWLSSEADRPAEITLTSAWSRRRTVALAWIEWFAGWPAVFALRRAR
ncbi:MAG TPA: DUF2917 domain-containing protein [Paraburkholderia sp.]|jgi:hypothetical protein|nr:DUF2917 domain-containing protein [Paraburkholderia sp.]